MFFFNKNKDSKSTKSPTITLIFELSSFVNFLFKIWKAVAQEIFFNWLWSSRIKGYLIRWYFKLSKKNLVLFDIHSLLILKLVLGKIRTIWLLKISILENGWTQPIVISPDGTIVDGFHRWTLGLKDKEVQKLTDGLVPVVTLTNLDQALSRLATIRHNRARGNHYVVKMADIIHELKALNLSDEEISQRLGMELEEVERLFDRGRSTKRNALKEFNKGWVPG